MNNDFTNACDREIYNNEHKGDWEEWHPTKKELIKEINWHMAKLSHALLSDNNDLIKEYSCDVANLCEKAYDEFGISLDSISSILKPYTEEEYYKDLGKEVKCNCEIGSGEPDFVSEPYDILKEFNRIYPNYKLERVDSPFSSFGVEWKRYFRITKGATIAVISRAFFVTFYKRACIRCRTCMDEYSNMIEFFSEIVSEFDNKVKEAENEIKEDKRKKELLKEICG